MKALEFKSQVSAKGQIDIPADLIQNIPSGSPVRVILLLEPTEEEEWLAGSTERFAAAYAEEDSIYEKLINEPPSR